MFQLIQKNSKAINYLFAFVVLSLFIVEPSFAASGGVPDKINNFLENIISLLRGVSILVVTIAVLWVGYKILWLKESLRDCWQIIAGALLIGGASEITQWLLG